MAALNHPNILSVFDVGDDYMVTEIVDGASLRGANFTQRKTLEVVAQIADGLAAAHEAGIVHRDLKPDNVLLTRDGRVKILDFGLARVNAASATQETRTITDPGTVMGTPGYMSPEQVHGSKVGHRSDIFSLGVILYELLAGKRAFGGESSADMMTAILREEPPELPDSVPLGLRQIVHRCLEKKPQERFQSARDLAFALRSLAGSTGAAKIVAAPARDRWLMPVAVVVFGALAVVFAVLWFTRPAGVGSIALSLYAVRHRCRTGDQPLLVAGWQEHRLLEADRTRISTDAPCVGCASASAVDENAGRRLRGSR